MMHPKSDHFISRLRLVMTVSNSHFMQIAVVAMSLLALIRLGYEFSRLLLDPGPLGAIDLLQRFAETKLWFSGQPIYGIEQTSPIRRSLTFCCGPFWAG